MTNTTRSELILLAEDEEHIAKLVAFKLSREGYSITIARDGMEACAQLAAQPWSLIILDVMMPLHDGWHVLRQLRALPATASVPVLMLTAKGNQKDVANAVQLGAEQYLRKPFDPAALAELVNKMIRG